MKDGIGHSGFDVSFTTLDGYDPGERRFSVVLLYNK